MLNKLRRKTKKTADPSQEEPQKRRLTRAMSKGGGSSSGQAPPSPPASPQEPERELTWGERFVQNNRGYMAPISEKFFRDVNRERLLRTVRVQECAYMPLSDTCSSMPIRERKVIRSFVGRPFAPWYKYYGSSAPTKIHIHHFNPIGRAWAEWVIHNLAPVANITEIQLPNALLVKMIMDHSNIDLGEVLSMDIRKIARVERPSVRLGHCNLIYALCKARGVPELVEDAEIQPVAPLAFNYFRTFHSNPVPAVEREHFVEEVDPDEEHEVEREHFVEEVDPDEEHEGDDEEDVDEFLNTNANMNEGGRGQEDDALMAEIDGFVGEQEIPAQHHEAPQGGYHYTHHEDELARMLHELDLYRSTGATHIYYNQQGSLYQDAMRYREEHPPPSDYELYPTRGEWEDYVHNDRERYEGMMRRRSREWKRSYLAHNPPTGNFQQSGYVPQGEEGPPHGYGDAQENPNMFCDYSNFGFGNVETNPDVSNPSRTPQ
ncbi:hypothetical protein TSUD_175970 [Trifolium subterraneum]|uniref:Putative plant transposon protein domain-containing protein n=1 Tax=Trifolium subterraneum TaxID=3900 RepID=A0A2Z6MPW6_TRISU|nr:hypothetical protein TSUD_175970 [Trifolium subterraneum]